MGKEYRAGLDVGSTTAKIVVLDDEDHIVYSQYRRHNAQVRELTTTYLNEIKHQLGNPSLRLCVTGSVGMATADELRAEFVQEVVAATVFARNRYPEARALVDIGGEDAKVVFFNGQSTELRMNGNCAGGTGAFIDQMALLLGCDNQRMSELAMTSTHVYPMAARCGVFAKTDVQNLMSRNLPESDIAASIFHSIAVQTVTTLSHGIDFTPPILLCGGPLTFLPALRKAFADYLHLEAKDFIVLKEGNLIPALGCAIRAGKEAEAVDIDELLDRIAHPEACRHQQNCGCTAVADADELQPLFHSEAEYTAWLRDKQRYATPLYPMHSGREEVVIGIDSGSTTTKLIVVRADKDHQGEIIFSDYSMNLGNPIHAVEQALKRLKQKAEESGTTLDIVGSCSTGYGEELIKAAFNLDDGIIVFLQDVAIA